MTSNIHLISPRLEKTLGCLLKRTKGRPQDQDARAFHRGPAFVVHPLPTIAVSSPDCGPSPAALDPEYLHNDFFKESGRIPRLSWACSASVAGQVREWLVVIEDLDAPKRTPAMLGLYAGLPAARTSLEPDDLGVFDDAVAQLEGGFYFGQNGRGSVYAAPKPMLNHGMHRYSFQVIALSEPLDLALLESRAAREQYAMAIRGLVLGWGAWTASCERRWA